MDNAYPLELRIDGESGEVIPEGQRTAVEIKIRYQLRPDENRIAVDPETLRGLQESLQLFGPDQASLKAVVQALIDLPKLPIVLPRATGKALEANVGADGTVVLPPADPAVLRSNRHVLKNAANPIAMTILMGADAAAVKHDYTVGTFSLDGEGKIMSSSLGRPDFQSPRGTQYRNGIRGSADEVPVILFGSTIVWMGPLGDLNAKQQSAMLALFAHSSERRSFLLTEDPYAVPAILGEGLGKMALDFGSLIFDSKNPWGTEGNEPVTLNLQVVRDSEGKLRVQTDGSQALAPSRSRGYWGSSGSEAPLGRIQVQMKFAGGPASVANRGLRNYFLLDALDFKVDPGLAQKKEIMDLLAFLRETFVAEGKGRSHP